MIWQFMTQLPHNKLQLVSSWPHQLASLIYTTRHFNCQGELPYDAAITLLWCVAVSRVDFSLLYHGPTHNFTMPWLKSITFINTLRCCNATRDKPRDWTRFRIGKAQTKFIYSLLATIKKKIKKKKKRKEKTKKSLYKFHNYSSFSSLAHSYVSQPSFKLLFLKQSEL